MSGKKTLREKQVANDPRTATGEREAVAQVLKEQRQAFDSLEKRLEDLHGYLSKRLERRYARLLEENLSLTAKIERKYIETCSEFAEDRKEAAEVQRRLTLAERERDLFLAEQEASRGHLEELRQRLAESEERDEIKAGHLVQYEEERDRLGREHDRLNQELTATVGQRDGLARELTAAVEERNRLSQDLSTTVSRLADVVEERDRLDRELTVIRTGRSWRVTRPLRWLSARLARLR